MCLSPVYTKNLYYGSRNPAHRFKDVSFRYAAYPCGHCADCLRKKQSDLVQRSVEEFKNCYCVFCTLTYNDEHLPKIVIGDYEYTYPDMQHFRLMIKRLRKSDILPPFKFLCSSEFGSKTHRPHFHFLIFIPKGEYDFPFDGQRYADKIEKFIKSDQGWSVNVSRSTKKPVYEHLSEFKKFADGRSTYDVHLVTSREGYKDEDVAYYVTKYVLKYDPWSDHRRGAIYANYPSHEARKIWNMIGPRTILSRGFGVCEHTREDIAVMLQKSLDSSTYKFPCYFAPDGSTSPLARFYRDRVEITPDGRRLFFYPDSFRIEFFERDDTRVNFYNEQVKFKDNAHYYQHETDYTNKVKENAFNRIKRLILANSD